MHEVIWKVWNSDIYSTNNWRYDKAVSHTFAFCFRRKLLERIREGEPECFGDIAWEAAVLELNSENSGTGTTFSETEFPINKELNISWPILPKNDNLRKKIKYQRHFFSFLTFSNFPANIYLFKINNRNPRKLYEICSQLTIKTSERHQVRRRRKGAEANIYDGAFLPKYLTVLCLPLLTWRHSGVFIINLKFISHLFLMFLFWRRSFYNV